MLLADYCLTPDGLVISKEIPKLAADECLRISREVFRGRSSMLLEVVSLEGRVMEQIMFPGLESGNICIELCR